MPVPWTPPSPIPSMPARPFWTVSKSILQVREGASRTGDSFLYPRSWVGLRGAGGIPARVCRFATKARLPGVGPVLACFATAADLGAFCSFPSRARRRSAREGSTVVRSSPPHPCGRAAPSRRRRHCLVGVAGEDGGCLGTKKGNCPRFGSTRKTWTTGMQVGEVYSPPELPVGATAVRGLPHARARLGREIYACAPERV